MKKDLSLGPVFKVVTIVTTLVPELEKVVIYEQEPGQGIKLNISKATPGVDVSALQVGQKLECTVQGTHALKVLNAKLIP